MFEGFTPETIDFLWGIRMNNNRDWFLEHKKQYVDTLYTPMKALGQQLFEPCTHHCHLFLACELHVAQFTFQFPYIHYCSANGSHNDYEQAAVEHPRPRCFVEAGGAVQRHGVFVVNPHPVAIG